MVGVMQIPIRPLMHVLDSYLEAGDGSSNGLHLYWLTEQHAIFWVIAHSLIYNRNLACGEGTRLDYCNVISATGDFGMTIIMLGRLFFMLSYCLAPTYAPSAQHRRRLCSEAMGALARSQLSLGVGSEAIWAWLLRCVWFSCRFLKI
jgi:hypothetical protein